MKEADTQHSDTEVPQITEVPLGDDQGNDDVVPPLPPTTEVPLGDDHGNADMLPPPPPIHPKTRRRCQKHHVLFLFLSLIIVALLATVVALVLIPEDQVDQTNEKSGASSLKSVQDFLIQQEVSKETDFQTATSPQLQAAQWMAKDDSLKLSIPQTEWEEKVINDAYHFVVRYALAVLYYATSDWVNQANFVTNKPVCEWWSDSSFVSYTGVQCDEDLGVPNGIKLEFNGLTGSLPSEISKIWSLKVIDVEYNSLTGSLPQELADMPHLRSLMVGRNGLSGPLPAGLGINEELLVLAMSNNLLSGTLPLSLTQSTGLTVLALDDNLFEGNLNALLTNEMNALNLVFLEDNLLTGTLNDGFLKNHHDLAMLDLSDNLIKGSLPVHFFEMSSLEVLDLHGNRLTGLVPEFPTNDVLYFLALHENQLNGAIPSSIDNLVDLKHLDLSQNQFRGTMPAEIGNMQSLTYLFLAENDFTTGPIPDSFGGLSNLRELSLKSTSRNGPIPDYISTFSEMILLDLDNNEMTGAIPTSLGDLNNLLAVLLNRNQFSGSVPSELGKLKKLQLLFMDGTSVTGTLAPLCELAQFTTNHTDLIADCQPVGDEAAEVECSCCHVCCSDEMVKCHANDFVPSSDPVWETRYQRPHFVFGNNTGFV